MGVLHKFMEWRGNTPLIFGQQGDSINPLLLGGVISPQQLARKQKQKAGVLGMGCMHRAISS